MLQIVMIMKVIISTRVTRIVTSCSYVTTIRKVSNHIGTVATLSWSHFRAVGYFETHAAAVRKQMCS